MPYLYCANFLKVYYNYVISDEGQKYIEEFQDLYKELSLHSGMSVKTPRDVGVIYTTIKSQVGIDMIMRMSLKRSVFKLKVLNLLMSYCKIAKNIFYSWGM